MLFADFNNDDIGDVITGFDDDGSYEGSGWFYVDFLVAHFLANLLKP